jgi:hypothetical protein
VLEYEENRLESLNEPEAEVSYIAFKLSADELRGHRVQSLCLEVTARDKVSPAVTANKTNKHLRCGCAKAARTFKV